MRFSFFTAVLLAATAQIQLSQAILVEPAEDMQLAQADAFTYATPTKTNTKNNNKGESIIKNHLASSKDDKKDAKSKF